MVWLSRPVVYDLAPSFLSGLPLSEFFLFFSGMLMHQELLASAADGGSMLEASPEPYAGCLTCCMFLLGLVE